MGGHLYSLLFPNIEAIRDTDDLERLQMFKSKLNKDIIEFLEMQAAAAKRIEELQNK
jgi:hypothetical protein